ncbi:hypothetical protein RvY_13086-1 [Ramazzottius varieornatus]|uniref:Solute carrier family 40 member n=1 Tax=Ramazzottius varieornatus TaxID=947166 RepID=A0A1D1VS28_RAMVA|nr:hypothetical protein RvY_13086-1 [Ramazzottius varieornatus]
MSEKPSPTSTVPVSDASSENEVKWLLYAAEILGRWGDRMWAFTSALFLLELFPGTMLLPAVYGLVVGLCVILLGALIGEWVDRTPRLAAVRLSLMTQNSCVALAALVLTFALLYKDSMPDSGKIWCVVGFLLFAVLADCGRVAMNIIVEKDWVVVIAAGNKSHLADMNATIRRIDLTCQILSPIIIAQIMTFSAHYVGTIVVSAWNLLSMFAEYFILLKIYHAVPALADPKATKVVMERSRNQQLVRKVFRSCFALSDGWKTYMTTTVASAGFGLALLHMTVLSFGGVTNTYVRTQGLSESVISIAMAFGAAVGIAGTFVFPVLRKKIGLERTGLNALFLQLVFLTLCVVSIWLPGSPFDPTFSKTTRGNESWIEQASENRNITDIDSRRWITRPVEELSSVIVFLLGMVGARFGLWMADLTISQLLQENVLDKERGVVGGVQSSLNRFMDLLKFLLVVGLPNPESFGILIIVSFLFVVMGDLSYAWYSYKTRGHIMPHCGPPPGGRAGSLRHDDIVLRHEEIIPSRV